MNSLALLRHKENHFCLENSIAIFGQFLGVFGLAVTHLLGKKPFFGYNWAAEMHPYIHFDDEVSGLRQMNMPITI